MVTSQAAALEQASQDLAVWLKRDYSTIKMIEHYLGTVSPADPLITDIVTQANKVIQPLLEAIGDAEIEHSLLLHRLGSCRAQFRNLSEYVKALPGRLPTSSNTHQRNELLAWLEAEIDGAPTERGNAP